MNNSNHLTAAELAARWGLSIGHLANERSAGRGIDYIKLGSRVLYRLSDVEHFENDCIVKAVA